MTAKKTAPVKAAPAAAPAKGKAAVEDVKKTAKPDATRTATRGPAEAARPAVKGATKAVAVAAPKGNSPTNVAELISVGEARMKSSAASISMADPAGLDAAAIKPSGAPVENVNGPA